MRPWFCVGLAWGGAEGAWDEPELETKVTRTLEPLKVTEYKFPELETDVGPGLA
jgi:hypothetical protein